MTLKLKPIALVVLGLLGTQAYAATASNQQIEQQIQAVMAKTKQLQNQVSTLKAKVADLKTRLHQSEMTKTEKLMFNKQTEEAVHAYSFVRLGSYLAQQYKFDGSDLIINAPSVLEDQQLLEERRDQNLLSKKHGFPEEETPYMVMSGEIEGQAIYTKPSNQGYNSDIDLTDLELVDQVVMSKWINGLIALEYDNGVNSNSPSLDRTNESRVKVNKAFITIGNLMYSPFYGSVGQMVVPFGRYSTAMVSNSLLYDLFRTKTRAASFGYYQIAPTGFYAHTFLFKATAGTTTQVNRFNNYGADVGMHFAMGKVTGDAGVSYISDIASSQGMLDNGLSSGFRGFAHSGSTTLSSKVGAYDLHAKVAVNPFNFILEYAQAATAFKQSDLSFDNSGAKPKALQAEAVYNFMTYNTPSSLALAYEYTRQALAFQLPRQFWGATVNFDIWRETMLSFEFRHNIYYGGNTTANGVGGGTAITGRGIDSNVVTAQLNMYF